MQSRNAVVMGQLTSSIQILSRSVGCNFVNSTNLRKLNAHENIMLYTKELITIVSKWYYVVAVTIVSKWYYVVAVTVLVCHYSAAVCELSSSLSVCSLSAESLSNAASAFTSLHLNFSINSWSCQCTPATRLVILRLHAINVFFGV